MRDPNVETIKRFISERVDKAFLQTYGANACTLGTTADGKPCLTLYVDATKPHYAKVAGPGKISFKAPEGEIDIPVKVVEAGATRFDKGGKSANDRVPGGVGIWVPDYSNYAADWGTLGGWAWDKQEHCAVFLSNAHVLGANGGRSVFYPDPAAKNHFGESTRGQITVDGKNTVDCAIGKPSDASRANFRVLKLGRAIVEINEPRKDMLVQKTGFTTHRTYGKIIRDDWSGNLHDDATGQTHFFSDCLYIEPHEPSHVWTDKGDSGSLVFSCEDIPGRPGVHAVVALHFGGWRATANGPWGGIACPIQAVFDALKITTLPSGVLSTVVASIDAASPLMMPMLGDFRVRCLDSAAGNRLLTVLDENRAELATLLAENESLRIQAASVLRSVFADAADIGEVMGRPISQEAIAGLHSFAAALRESCGDEAPALAAAIDDCMQDIPAAGGSTTMNGILSAGAPVMG